MPSISGKLSADTVRMAMLVKITIIVVATDISYKTCARIFTLHPSRMKNLIFGAKRRVLDVPIEDVRPRTQERSSLRSDEGLSFGARHCPDIRPFLRER